MKKLLQTIYLAISQFLHESKIVNSIICLQHSYLPLPINLYYKLYSNKYIGLMFSWYGHHVYHHGYNKRMNDIEYWSSEESLYYYCISQSQPREAELNAIFSRIDLTELLENPETIVLDLGCGTMKDIRKLIAEGDLRSRNVYGVDYNEVLTKYFALIGGLPNGVEYRFGVIQEEIEKIGVIDLVFILGGTLQYIPRRDVIIVLEKLKEQGVKAIIIIGEGSEREDYLHKTGVWVYQLTQLIRDAGYGEIWQEDFETKVGGEFTFWFCFDKEKIHRRNNCGLPPPISKKF